MSSSLYYLCPTCATVVLEIDDDTPNADQQVAALARDCHLCGNPLDSASTAPMLLLLGLDDDRHSVDTIVHMMCSLPTGMQPRYLGTACPACITADQLQALRAQGAVVWHITGMPLDATTTNATHISATLLDNGDPIDLQAQARTAWARELIRIGAIKP